MDLKGAEIRNIFNVCRDMNSSEGVPLRVNIPHYQRPYKWDQDRIQNLIYDFFKNKEEEENHEYFVGSVVLVRNTKFAGPWQDIIDGQQRVTTVFLLNYLRFLFLRAYTEDLIIRKSPASFSGKMTELIACYSGMFGSTKEKELNELKEQIITKIDTLDETDDAEKDKVWDTILADYQEKVGLPEKNLSDMEQYKKEYEKQLYHFLEKDNLALRYSRETYNRKLKEALARVVLLADKANAPKILPKCIEEEAIANQYVMALVYEFNALKEKTLSGKEKPIEAISEMIKAIEEMLVSIKFCVIMTGNENDAYTLFEVLNDRAMKVDDLDLIKNLFLKEYCNKSGETDQEIDRNVAEIDELWGDKIFTQQLGQSHTKLISYLGTIYLTADDDIYTNKVEKYREVIDKKYLSLAYKNKPYTALNVKNDIRIYQMIKIIFEKFDLHVNNTDSCALKAELDNNKSITYKTLNLINALSQNGVMAALTNLIVRTYIDQHVKVQEEIDVSNFEDYVKRLCEDKNHDCQEFADIHKWAFEIWKVSILAKDYGIPRTISKMIISHVSVFNNALNGICIGRNTESQLEKDFMDWTEAWQYGAAKQSLKLKILFIELFATYRNDHNLVLSRATSCSFKTDKLHLDHLEARNPEKGCPEFYYSPEDPTVRREKIINGLGNMMILDQDDNNDKNNLPLERALDYYTKMCPSGHWLIDEIKEELKNDSCHKEIVSGSEKVSIPKDAFFAERRKKLQKYFYAILRRKELTDTEMNI